MTRELAYFYLTTYAKLNNAIFGVKRYDIQRHIRDLCLDKNASPELFYKVASIMLIYYATQTYPKRIQLKRTPFTVRLVEFVKRSDARSCSPNSFFSEFDLDEIKDNAPTWFVQTLGALKNLQGSVDVNGALYILLRKVCGDWLEKL